MSSHSNKLSTAKLHLSHSRHTGHVLPRHNTSYPVLLMILLCVGVLLFGMTRLVAADTQTRSGQYTVSTSVPGPPPTVAASIDNQTSGTHYTSQPITLAGSCPQNTYVEVFRNKFFSGVAECDVSGQWTMTSALFPGANQLQAKVFSYTDVPGPVEPAITIYYDPPKSSGTGNTSSGGSSVTTSPSSETGATTNSGSVVTIGEPLILKSDFTYQGVYVGDVLTWQLDVEGGQAPYGVNISWGDGSQQVVTRPTSGPFTVTHTYHKAGDYHGSYPVKFNAGDAAGSQTFLQLLAIVNNQPTHSGAGSGTASGSGGGLAILSSGNVSRALHYLWPSYGVTVLMLSSFWLGERRELRMLTRTLRHHH